MKVWEFAWGIVLLLAGTAQTLRPAQAYSDKEWQRPQSESADPAGPWTEEIAGPRAPSTAGPSDGESGDTPRGTMYRGPLHPSLDISSGLSDDLAASETEEIRPLPEDHGALPKDGAGAAAQLGGSPLSGIGDWQGTGRYWTADSQGYSDAGFASVEGRANLPAFSEIDWTSTALPAQEEAFFMETVVFPALGAVVLVCSVILVVAWVRKHRAVSQSQVQHLLHV